MKSWQQSGNIYALKDITTQIPTLPAGIYAIREDMFKSLYLEKRSDKFEFMHKVYGKDQSFIDRVQKTYESTTGNIGVLLNGVKGTGKSVTAKLLCNQLNIPVLTVDENFDELVPFLSELPQDIVVMMDEYEKVFGDSRKLLGVMDGVDASLNRRVFVMTTNESYINGNMLSRPSRIRYVKHYNNLDLITAREIIEDRLLNKEYKEDLLTVMRDMTTITIDLLISLIEEINIHDEPASKFLNVFNVELKNPHFDIYEEDGKTEVAKNVTIPYGRNVMANPGKFLNHMIYYEDFNDNDIEIGTYKGFKDGVWNFELEGVPRKLIFRKAVTNVYYAYE
jgi:hypothetical protein